MNGIEKNQVKQIYTLLGQQGLRGRKGDVVASFSGGRTEHVSELTKQEAAQMIAKLNEKNLEGFKAKSSRLIPGDAQRKKIIHYAHQMNYYDSHGRIDMARINQWCIKYGYLHKPLMQYRLNELPKLVTQFERIYIGYLRAVRG